MDIKVPVSYSMLKALVANKPTTSTVIDNLKKYYSAEIASPRRAECIQTLLDLIDCLERRDVLSEYNIEVLKNLTHILNNQNIHLALLNYVAPDDSDEPVNQYATQRLNEEQSKLKKRTTLIEFNSTLNEKKRNAIYKLIAKEVGYNWRSFGRELGICEGDLDEIEIQHPRDLSSRVYKLFSSFEKDEQHDPEEHALIICRALDDCRRKDIRRNVEAILRRRNV